jgi:hypothetical protein
MSIKNFIFSALPAQGLRDAKDWLATRCGCACLLGCLKPIPGIIVYANGFFKIILWKLYILIIF